jgi:UDP-glucose 4-epimerase
VRGFTRRRPDVTTTVLRLAPFVGPHADTTLTRYFALPVVPTVFGRDPRLQFIHVDDALEILERAVVENHRGTYNVGRGRRDRAVPGDPAGRPARVPVVEPGCRRSPPSSRRRASATSASTSRPLRARPGGRHPPADEEFGFRPRSTQEAFADFVEGRGLHRAGGFAALRPDAVSAVEALVWMASGPSGAR